MSSTVHTLDVKLCKTLFQTLINHYGGAADPDTWWPVYHDVHCPPEFERVWTNLLVNQTTWPRVRPAIDNLHSAGLLALAAMAAADPSQIAALIKATGLARAKTEGLQATARLVIDRFETEVRFCARTTREELICLPRVGPETADRTLLYACGRWAWPVDSYCLRVFAAYGLINRVPHTARERCDVSPLIKDVVVAALDRDVPAGQRFHATMQLEGERLRRDPQLLLPLCSHLD